MTTEIQYAEQPDAAPEEAPHAAIETSVGGANRWLFYLIGLTISVILIFILPQPYPILLLVGVVGVALLIAARDAGLTPASIVRDARQLRTRVRAAFASIPRAEADETESAGISRRERAAQGFALASVALMILAAIGFRPARDAALQLPVLLMLLGGAALGVAVKLSPRAEAIAMPQDAPLTPARSRWLPLALGVSLLAVLALINAGKLEGHPAAVPATMHTQFALLAGGIALVVWGMAGAPRLTPRREWFAAFSWDEAAPLLVIFLLGFGLRVWGLDTTIRYSVDEAVVLEGVSHAWNYTAAGLVTQVSDRLSASQVFPYWQTIAIDLFGHTLTGLRFTNALVGSLNILAIYLLAKALFDRKTALLAAFLLATFPPHLHFSRIAMAHITDPLFGTLALAFLVRGLKHNRRLDWALMGACFGLTHYFFEGGRLLFLPLFVAGVVFMAIVLRGHLQAHWRGLLVAFITMFFTIAPMYYQIFAFDRARATRMEDSGVGLSYFTKMLEGGVTGQEIGDIAYRLTFPFLVYVHQPEIAFFYAGETPLILDYIVPVFLLGVFYLVWRWRSPAALLLGWIILTALGNSLMRDMAYFARFVVVLPALALMLAVGVRYVLPLVLPGRKPDALLMPAVILVTALGVMQVAYYFGPHLTVANRMWRNMAVYDGMDAVIRAADVKHENARVILIGDPAFDPSVARIFDGYLSGRGWDDRLESYTPAQVTPELLAELPEDKPFIFFVAPGSESMFDLLARYFRLDPPQQTPYDDVPPEKAYTMVIGWRHDDNP